MSDKTTIVTPPKFRTTISVDEKRITVKHMGGPQGEAGPAGSAGAAGPNTVTTSTTTNITGILKGNGSNVSSATAGTDYQSPLGFTPENSANKTTNFTGNTGSNTLFPTVKAIFDALVGYLAGYQPILGFNPANENLSNLVSTSVNTDLFPQDDQLQKIGQAGQNWSRVNTSEIAYDDSIGYDVKNAKIYDVSVKRSIDLNDRQLLDEAETVSVQYGSSRSLLDSAGLNCVEWEFRRLLDDSERLSAEWLDRRLFASDGATPVLDWSSTSGPTAPTQAQNDNSSKIATTEYVDAQPKTITRVYTSTDTWTKPTGIKALYTELCGGGGGGGAGRRGPAGSVRCGGGGGSGGAIVRGWFIESDLPSSATVTVGAAGVGASANTLDGGSGASGGAGGTSSFGSLISAPGGGGGGGGTAASGGAGSVTFSSVTPDYFAQKAGVAASGSGGAGTAGTASTDIAAPSGGSAGGITSGNSPSSGAAGGARGATTYRTGFTAAGGTAGTGGAGAGGAAGNGSSASATYFGLTVGAGGGGGGARTGAASGSGGNGTGYGSGGGGGAASENGNNSGAGGSGGPGFVIFVEYY